MFCEWEQFPHNYSFDAFFCKQYFMTRLNGWVKLGIFNISHPVVEHVKIFSVSNILQILLG